MSFELTFTGRQEQRVLNDTFFIRERFLCWPLPTAIHWQVFTDCSWADSYHSDSYVDDNNDDYGSNNHKHNHNACCNVVSESDAFTAK